MRSDGGDRNRVFSNTDGSFTLQIPVDCEVVRLGTQGSCIHGGMPVPTPVEDIPEHLASVLEMHECRDDGAFGAGAMYGALTYGAASTVFTFLPAVWLNWQLQGSWKLLIQPAVVVTVWTVVGTVFGAVALKVLSAVLAPSWTVFQRAVRGMLIGFAIGAVLGAACIFFRHVAMGHLSVDTVWLDRSGQVTGSSISVGSLFAVFGSWAGAILTGPLQTKRQPVVSSGSARCSKRGAQCDGTPSATADMARDRFQFSISRMLFLTAAIAVIVAIPVHILARLREISQLASYMIAFEIMMVLFGILALPFLAWVTLRGPKVYARLTETLTRCRNLKLSDHELKEWASQQK
jgi:hypothetical protein